MNQEDDAGDKEAEEEVVEFKEPWEEVAEDGEPGGHTLWRLRYAFIGKRADASKERTVTLLMESQSFKPHHLIIKLNCVSNTKKVLAHMEIVVSLLMVKRSSKYSKFLIYKSYFFSDRYKKQNV